MALELGPELERFVDKYINSFAHWDLVVLLFKKGEVAEEAADIARQVGRKEEEVKAALENLVKLKLVKKNKKGTGYLPNPSYSEVAASFIETLESRDKRLLILTKVLEKGIGEEPS